MERAVESNPGDAAAHYGLGFCHRVLGLGESAAECFAVARRLQPEEWHYNYHLGKQLGLNGDLITSLGAFAAAIELDPLRPGPLYDAGSCLARASFYELATVCYTITGVLCQINSEACRQAGIKRLAHFTALDLLEASLGRRFGEVQDETYRSFEQFDPRTADSIPEELLERVCRAAGRALLEVAER